MGRFFKSFLTDRSGAHAVEFALVAPLFLALIFSTLEAGWAMARAVMLDRALDIAIRDVRIGGPNAPDTQAEIKDLICSETLIILDCKKALLVEIVRIKTAADFPSDKAKCVDRGSDLSPTVSFTPGERSDIMFLRACVVIDPLVPLIGLGLNLQKDPSGGFAMTSSTAFMNEPE